MKERKLSFIHSQERINYFNNLKTNGLLKNISFSRFKVTGLYDALKSKKSHYPFIFSFDNVNKCYNSFMINRETSFKINPIEKKEYKAFKINQDFIKNNFNLSKTYLSGIKAEQKRFLKMASLRFMRGELISLRELINKNGSKYSLSELNHYCFLDVINDYKSVTLIFNAYKSVIINNRASKVSFIDNEFNVISDFRFISLVKNFEKFNKTFEDLFKSYSQQKNQEKDKINIKPHGDIKSTLQLIKPILTSVSKTKEWLELTAEISAMVIAELLGEPIEEVNPGATLSYIKMIVKSEDPLVIGKKVMKLVSDIEKIVKNIFSCVYPVGVKA